MSIFCSIGNPKAAVLPVPVCAKATRSMSSSSKSGIVFSCTSLGVSKPKSGQSIEGNFKIDYQITKDLTATSRIGFKRKNFSPEIDYGFDNVFNVGRSTVNQGKVNNHSYTWEAFLVYKKQIANHNFSATFGHSAQKTWGDGLFATGYDVPNNSWDFADIGLTTGTADNIPNGSYIYDTRLTSLFGRLQYDYKGKYLLSAMWRRDGSSESIYAP